MWTNCYPKYYAVGICFIASWNFVNRLIITRLAWWKYNSIVAWRSFWFPYAVNLKRLWHLMAKLTAVKVRDSVFAMVVGSTNCVLAGLSNSLVCCKQNGFPGMKFKLFTFVTIFCNENCMYSDVLLKSEHSARTCPYMPVHALYYVMLSRDCWASYQWGYMKLHANAC